MFIIDVAKVNHFKDFQSPMIHYSLTGQEASRDNTSFGGDFELYDSFFIFRDYILIDAS